MQTRRSIDYIQSLQEAIRKAHGCRSKHAASVPVEELSRGKTIWKGTVEVFDLIGHARAKLCYAWRRPARSANKQARIVTVLAVFPVDSPLKAVQMFLATDTKCDKPKSTGR